MLVFSSVILIFYLFFENIAKNGKIYEEIFYIFCFIVLKCTRFAPFA
ncbi:hypothetical protein CU026_2592 [Enterococcus faecium]|uniref:Uncharacterized protein n=4 Tax=Enterococcus faecium TaxID=1352 RepID=A0A1S8IZE8_ENTFC|nr:hypothetical protein HMPREF0351_10684 [Enterococcus faecium DO]AGE29484.1 hypothetical protein M7W_847 [Enterococcus faecium ATCC 8459 = NRRL B-2354]APV53613.1 hypothetical protein AL026_05500 [Enterococcus faecium]EFF27308.1 hypothetical protein EfmE1679_0576 [Enterococcus faecium E1679]EFF28078.1 hypothetical protein EfmU0317_2968 [Enterococcus faecium U0317]EFF33607.1 hypothetical protein EfmE1162_2666 [Enterococcus faecium E1162]EFR66726.1 hypothetical protein HMPREF9524_03155 [Enteroc